MARRELAGIGLATLIVGGALGFGAAKLTESNASNQGARNGSEASPTPKPSAAAGSATPEASPTAAPKASASAEVKSASTGTNVTSFGDYEMKPGETRKTTGAALIKGDVVVDGKVYYDNDPKTGLLVEINEGSHTIFAQWGANVQTFGENPDRNTFVSVQGDDVELMKQKGCDPKPQPGCDSVKVVKIGAATK